MKSITIVSLSLASLLVSAAPSFALIQQVQACQTTDGQYGVYIDNDQGNGLKRTDHLIGVITDAQGAEIGSYSVSEVAPRIQPISFTHATYTDNETAGNDFTLVTPSTNGGGTIQAVLKDGSVLSGSITCRK